MVLEYTRISSLNYRQVFDANSKPIGRIKDALIDNNTLELKGLLIQGSTWDDLLREIGIKKDANPIITPDLVATSTNDSIKLNKTRKDLESVLKSKINVSHENVMLFSSLQKRAVYDNENTHVGMFTDIILEKELKHLYELGGKEFFLFLKKNNLSDKFSYVIDPKEVKLVDKGVEKTYQLQMNIKAMTESVKVNMTNVVRDLMVTANKDGVITDDEKALIDVVTVDLNMYQQALTDALKDGIITEEEQQKLDEIKDKILKHMYHVAGKDKKITADERALIEKIASYMIKEKNEYFWRAFGSYGLGDKK